MLPPQRMLPHGGLIVKNQDTMGKTMRVLILLTWAYPIGGIENFVWRLANSLSSHVAVAVGVFFYGKKASLSSKRPGLTVTSMPYASSKATRRLFHEFKPDVVHINSFSLIGLLALFTAKRRNIPVLITNHQTPSYKMGLFSPFRNAFFRIYYGWFNNRTDQVVVPSRTTQKLVQSYTKQPVSVISSGVDTARFRPTDQAQARKALRFPDRDTVLFVGRIALDKDLDLLLKAIARLKEKRPIHCVLAGPTPPRRNARGMLERLIKSLNIQAMVTQTGFVAPDSQKLVSLYNAANVFVIPSYFETQSIVTLEAMACGVPVAASNSGALPELVHNRINGLLFRRGDERDLADTLTEILGSKALQKQFGTQGRKLVEEHALIKTARAYEKIYLELFRRIKG